MNQKHTHLKCRKMVSMLFVGCKFLETPRIYQYFDDKLQVKLFRAATAKDITRMQQLVSTGAQINKPGKEGITLLHFALITEDLDAVPLLLSVGSDPNLKADNGISCVIFAALMPNSEVLKELLKYGGNPNSQDNRGETPLMLAASAALEANVEVLLDYGANVNAIDDRGSTPLMHVFQSFSPNKNIERMLLLKGADPTIKDPLGLTAKDYELTFERK